MTKYYLGCILMLLLIVGVPATAFVFLSPSTATLVTLAYFVLLFMLVKMAGRAFLKGVGPRAQEPLETVRQQNTLMESASVTVHRFEEVPEPPAEMIQDG